MTSDRDLLEALFVQQLGFAPASEVMAAGAQWLVQRETGAGLSDVLQSRGLLDAKQVQLVDALVSEGAAAPPSIRCSSAFCSAAARWRFARVVRAVRMGETVRATQADSSGEGVEMGGGSPRGGSAGASWG